MTIEELSSDKQFFEGLRKGEYCLVLGAGFSAGLKNKSTPDILSTIRDVSGSDFYTIPLVGAYVSLTNKIFDEEVSKGEAAANIWESNNFALKINEDTFDLKPFYKDLFTLDEDWFKENKLEKYKSILYPDWYQVYTFNFDNVFEVIVKQKARKDFYTLHFPEHKGDITRRTLKKAIHHLHGYILETSPEILTFSQTTYLDLERAEHTLYDPFHADIDSGKKLVIIGNQFDERNIDRLFFEGLRNKNITIYHFSRSNGDFRTKPGISGNPNYHFVKINETHEVLDFFEKYKVQIENIKIEGADVINSDFIEKVEREGKKEGFTASNFYLAKQVDECQWFGLTQNWVVERDNYDFIKQEIVSSFDDEKRNSKISALLWGLGGSGKSTLLRKLAFDLSDEDFTVLWIKDKSIQSFYDEGLGQLRSDYAHKKFLVVIEDLYRVKQQDINLKQIISSICSNTNVRLIVGDRKNGDGSYKEHIYNPDQNIFELTIDDNKRTLDKLLENIPEWKTAANSLLKNEEDYNSTLYYILWTIGRTVEKGKVGSIDEHQDLTSHFRSLVESDLKTLSNTYPGVAKMLYYWANIYAKNKIYFSYDLFFKLAEKFKTPLDQESQMLHASPSHKSVFDIYSHKATGFIKRAGEIPLFAFNHDILAEEGLSKSKLSEWNPFDDSVKLAMLPMIISEGDEFSSSNFLSHCLRYIPKTSFSNEKKIRYVNELRSVGNLRGYLYYALNGKFYSRSEKIDLATSILNKPMFWELESSVVCESLNILRDKEKADEILSQENFWILPDGIVTAALNISKDKNKADKILSRKDFWNLPHAIVCTALNISKDKDKADEILSRENFWNLAGEIVSTALNISKDINKTDKILAQENFWNLPLGAVSTTLSISKDKDRADEVLSQENFWNLPHQIVSTALNISKDKDKADKILSQKNFWNLSHQIVSTALNISKDKDKADKILSLKDFWDLPHAVVSTALNISKDKDKTDEVLSQENFWTLSHQIVSTALKISKDENKADEILSQKNFWNLPHAIVSAALNISTNGVLIEKVGKKLLETGQWKEKWSFTYHILYFYSNENSISKPINSICNTIISEFLDRSNTDNGKFFRYANLMKIPFHSLPEWKKSSLENIRRWRYRPRNLVTNTILAYQLFPNEIREMCAGILQDWKIEISKPVHTFGRTKEPHKGNHILLSLGHPDLEEFAKQTAKQIRLAELASSGLIPKDLLLAVNQIIDEGELPIWNLVDNHKDE